VQGVTVPRLGVIDSHDSDTSVAKPAYPQGSLWEGPITLDVSKIYPTVKSMPGNTPVINCMHEEVDLCVTGEGVLGHRMFRMVATMGDELLVRLARHYFGDALDDGRREGVNVTVEEGVVDRDYLGVHPHPRANLSDELEHPGMQTAVHIRNQRHPHAQETLVRCEIFLGASREMFPGSPIKIKERCYKEKSAWHNIEAPLVPDRERSSLEPGRKPWDVSCADDETDKEQSGKDHARHCNYKNTIKKNGRKSYPPVGSMDGRDDESNSGAPCPPEDDSVLSQNIEAILQKASTRDSDFLASISHEMRTPLNGIIGIIDLMSREDTAEDIEIYLRTLEQSCRILMSVVNRCQDLSYLQTEHKEKSQLTFDLNAVVTGISQTMQYYNVESQETTQLKVELDPRIPFIVKADLTKIQQVLTNLCVIAANISTHGYVELNLVLKHVDVRECTVGVTVKSGSVASEDYYNLCDETLLHLKSGDMFDHHSLNSKRISLSIARRFLQELDAELCAKRVGDTLVFSFALALESTEALPTKHMATVPIDDTCVLVVDDNHVNQMVVAKMLRLLKVKSHVVGDGQQAVECLQQGKKFDMIFMDLDMPVMDGYEATKRIREELGLDVTIVALTANSTNKAKKKCKETGMNDYFTKPITVQTLSEMIRKWHRRV